MILSSFRRTFLGLTMSAAIPGLGAAQTPDFLKAISAGKVVAVSDGDFVAETYATSILAPVDAGYQDLLTVMSIIDGQVVSRTLPVSNSVTSAPEVIELTPDGRTVFVTERLGQRARGKNTVKDLPAGNRLFAIDLANGGKPQVTDVAQIAINPESLAVSPDGRNVAVISNTQDASLVQIVRFERGTFGEVARFDMADLGIAGTADSPRSGVTGTNVQWHPSGKKLAININTQNRVVFLDVGERAGNPVVKRWGAPVNVGADPFVGRFTPDGRYYLTSNWGRDFSATNLADRIRDASSTMSVIRLAAINEDGEPRHERLLTVDTGVSAEGMAVSPDGRLVATINMRGSIFPQGSPRFQREASVSLLRFDSEAGTLQKLAEHRFEGALPEGATFDLTGDHLLATVFQGHAGADPEKGSGLDVYRVVRGDSPSLERLGRVSMPHGVHHVDVSR